MLKWGSVDFPLCNCCLQTYMIMFLLEFLYLGLHHQGMGEIKSRDLQHSWHHSRQISGRRMQNIGGGKDAEMIRKEGRLLLGKEGRIMGKRGVKLTPEGAPSPIYQNILALH